MQVSQSEIEELLDNEIIESDSKHRHGRDAQKG
jgi:hypothetical protein